MVKIYPNFGTKTFTPPPPLLKQNGQTPILAEMVHSPTNMFSFGLFYLHVVKTKP